MKVDYLSKLLLQHDASPYLESLDLIKAARDHKLVTGVHPKGADIVVALGQRVVLLSLPSQPSETHPLPHFFTATQAPESVTSAAWLWSPSSDDVCLLIGTSDGFLQIHAPSTGTLIHRQQFHNTAVTSLHVRYSGFGVDPSDASEDVTIASSDAAARLPAYDIWPAVLYAQRHESGGWLSTPLSRLTPPATWDLKGIGPRMLVACAGLVPPNLYSLLSQRQYEPHRLLLFTAGADPPFATFSVEEAMSTGLLSLVGSLAVSSVSDLLGRAKSLLPTRRKPTSRIHESDTSSGGGGGVAGGTAEKKKKEKIVGMAALRDASVWDDARRRVTGGCLSPCCRWAACCDSLGRISVVETAGCMILQVLKGYRDAQTGWFVPSHGSRQSRGSLLVIYAPRRGVVELWRAQQGMRVGSVACAARGALLLSPPLPVGVSPRPGWREQSPNRCWLLDLTALNLIDLSEELNELAAGEG